MKGLKELVPEMDCPQITEGVDGEGGGLATNGESDWIFKGFRDSNCIPCNTNDKNTK
jgi:hypothetical protein